MGIPRSPYLEIKYVSPDILSLGQNISLLGLLQFVWCCKLFGAFDLATVVLVLDLVENFRALRDFLLSLASAAGGFGRRIIASFDDYILASFVGRNLGGQWLCHGGTQILILGVIETIDRTTSVDERRIIVKVDVKGCGLKWEGHEPLK